MLSTFTRPRQSLVLPQVPLIDPYSSEGDKQTTLAGEIRFDNVSFAYPQRPDVKVGAAIV